MYIEPPFADFRYVRIRRTGGIIGMDQSIHVGPDLRASVRDSHAGDRTFALDAWAAQELMAALSTLVARRPDPSTRQGFDLFRYDIELAWNGTVYRIDSVDLGADEALHGVMLAANKLLRGEPQDVHAMSLHATPHVEPEAPASVLLG